MDVSVIYVNWNSAADILHSMESVREKTAGTLFEVVVVDNDSKEDISSLERPDIRLIRNTHNAGFGAGCNLGARHATGDCLLFLNPDTVLVNDVLGGLKNFLDTHPQAGAVGPLTLEDDGSVHYGAARSFPSLTNEFLELSTLTFKFPRGRWTGRPYYSYWDHRDTRRVDTLMGSCMMMRRRDFEQIGGFDERFFLYFEEVDLCRRVWNSGREVWYLHEWVIIHEGHKSTVREYGSMAPMLLIYFESAEKYLRKHHGRLYSLTWRVMMTALFGLRYLRRRTPAFKAYFKWGLNIVHHHHSDA